VGWPAEIEASTVKLVWVRGPYDELQELLREIAGSEGELAGLTWRVRVSPEQARQLVARYAELDGVLEYVEEPRYRIAFDPRHPLRGDQPLVRLTWVENSLALDHGTLDRWSVGETVAFASHEALARAVASQCEAWASEGLAIARDERELLAAVSARDLRLEAAIREADDPHEAATVYVDWLQSQGDPRGLIGSDPLEHHTAHLFGSTASLLNLLELEWSSGVLTGLSNMRIPLPSPMPTWFEGPERGHWRELDPLFEILLNLPICGCLRSLRIRGRAVATGYVQARLELVDPVMRAGIRHLVLDAGFGPGVFRCELLPNLESLSVGVGQVYPLRFERMRTLSMTCWNDTVIEVLSESRLPQLRELDLRLDYDALRRLEALLSCPALQTVESLVLSDFWTPGDRVDVEYDLEILAQLLRAPLTPRLRRLDLRKFCRSQEFLDAIEAARDRLPELVEVETIEVTSGPIG
jgi:hypothetical protein